jgi:hypothetical protein
MPLSLAEACSFGKALLRKRTSADVSSLSATGGGSKASDVCMTARWCDIRALMLLGVLVSMWLHAILGQVKGGNHQTSTGRNHCLVVTCCCCALQASMERAQRRDTPASLHVPDSATYPPRTATASDPVMTNAAMYAHDQLCCLKEHDRQPQPSMKNVVWAITTALHAPYFEERDLASHNDNARHDTAVVCPYTNNASCAAAMPKAHAPKQCSQLMCHPHRTMADAHVRPAPKPAIAT